MTTIIHRSCSGLYLCALMLLLAAVAASLAVSKPGNAAEPATPVVNSVIMPVAGDDFPDDVAKQKFIDSTFKNVKASHIFVCQRVQIGELPTWLESEALVAEAKNYITTGPNPIEYADKQKHEPDVRECKYDPVLDEPGNLNFIVKVSLSRMPVDGRQIPFFTISRIIYRPDHRTSIEGFLQNEPMIVPLADEAKAKEVEQSHLKFWSIGYSDEAEFNR